MRTLQVSLTGLGSSILAFCMFAAAQTRDPAQYVISAKAGGVNLASGGAELRHKTETEWQALATKDHLAMGDLVRTESDGRLEVLLNPGSYLRVDADSEFEFTDPSLNSLRIKFLKGSGILEVTGFEDVGLLSEIDTPHARIEIFQNGLYRINVQPDRTELIVRKGRAFVGSGTARRIKGGQRVTASGPAGVELTKFDKKAQDPFDQWSFERAETLIAANRQLSESHIAYSLVSAMDSGWGYDSWLHRGMGVWIFNPRLSCHTFYPFYSGMSSPYGHYRVGLGVWPGRYRPLEHGPKDPAPPPTLGPINPPRSDLPLPLRLGPFSRKEQHQMQERISPDIIHSHATDAFERRSGTPSGAVHSGPAPASPAAPHPHDHAGGAHRQHGRPSPQQ